MSYVWGAPRGDDLQAMVGNIADLKKERSLQRDYTLPATIRDSIITCDKLDIRYLWVDRLCIIQDDSEGKLDQINAMGDIYSGSYVTIVALAGDSAHSGLPGVSQTKRDVPLTFEMQDLHLVRQHRPYQSIAQTSKWSTRGWTFQEAKFSPRMLLFSDSGVFYECCHGEMEVEDDFLRVSGMFVHRTMFDSWSYDDLVTSFTRRNLSFEGDIIRAFTGILNSRYGSDHYFGLPAETIPQALLWKTGNGKYIRRLPDDGDVLPSWSWCSVKGEIGFHKSGSYPEDGRLASIATCAIMSLEAGKSALHVFQHQAGIKSNDQLVLEEWKHDSTIDAAVIIMTAWRKGFLLGTLPDELKNDAAWHEYKDMVVCRWPSIVHLSNDAHGISEGGSVVAEDLHGRFPLSHMEIASVPGRIMMYTQSLCVTVASALEDGYIMLRTKGNIVIGWLLPNTVEDPERLCRSYGEENSNFLFDVLAVSLSWNSRRVSSTPRHKNRRVAECCYDSRGDPFCEHDRGHPEFDWLVLVNLMVVETRGGISRRVSLGQAYLNPWVEACPQWGTFIIE